MSTKKIIGYIGLASVFLLVLCIQAYEYGLFVAILNWVIVAVIFAIMLYCAKLINEG